MNEYFRELLLAQAWQIAAMTLLVFCVAKAVGDRRPHLIQSLWLLVILKCLTPPVWGHSLALFTSLQGAFFEASNTVPSVMETESSAVPLDLMTAHSFDEKIVELSQGRPVESEIAENRYGVRVETGPAVIDLTEAALPMMALLLIVGILLSFFGLSLRYLRCVREIRRKRVFDFDFQTEPMLEELCRKLRIRRAPSIVVSDVGWGPAVMGFFRHVIVLPRCLLDSSVSPNGQDGETIRWLEPVIAHELLHIRRGDLVAGILQSFAKCLWWFHPGVWFANRMLSRETERCCDAQVLEELGCRPSVYARCLLSVIEMKQPLKAVPVFPGMKPVEITSQRMERIMSQNVKRRGVRRPVLNGIVLALSAVILLPGAAASRSVEESQSITAAPIADTDGGRFLHVEEGAVDLCECPDVEAALHQMLGDFTKDELTMEAVQREMKSLQALLRREGFLDARVDARVQGGPLVVKYTVESGLRYQVRRIRGLNTLVPKSTDQAQIREVIESQCFTEAAVRKVRRKISDCFRVDGQPTRELSITPVFLREVGQVDLSVEMKRSTSETSPASAVQQLLSNQDVADRVTSEDDEHVVHQKTEMTASELEEEIATVRSSENHSHVSNVATADQTQNETPLITVAPRIIIEEEEELLGSPILLPSRSIGEKTVSEGAGDPGSKRNTSQGVKPAQAVSTRVYCVADLVVPVPGLEVDAKLPSENRVAASSATSIAVLKTIDSTDPAVAPQRYRLGTLPHTAGTQIAAGHPDRVHRDLQRSIDALVALIRASVRPDSWGNDAAVEFQTSVLALVVRQSDDGHDQIAELLTALRREQEVMVVMQAAIVELSAGQEDSLNEIEFQETERGYDWALLSESRVGKFIETLQADGGTVLSAPKITTLPNVKANVEVSGRSGSPSLRLATVPRPIGDTDLMRLQFEVGIGADTTTVGSATLKSQQTVLLRHNVDMDVYHNKAPSDHLRSALDQKVSLRFESVPLMRVLKDTAIVTETNMAMDVPALSSAGLDFKQLVSLDVQGVPFSVALDRLLAQVGGATYESDGDVLRITVSANKRLPAKRRYVIAITPRIIRRSELPLHAEVFEE